MDHKDAYQPGYDFIDQCQLDAEGPARSQILFFQCGAAHVRIGLVKIDTLCTRELGGAQIGRQCREVSPCLPR